MRPILTALAFLAFCHAVFADPIIGRWRPADGTCDPTGGMMVITDETLVQDEIVCDFFGEIDLGDARVWKSRCYEPDGAERMINLSADARGRQMVFRRAGVEDAQPYVRCR